MAVRNQRKPHKAHSAPSLRRISGIDYLKIVVLLLTLTFISPTSICPPKLPNSQAPSKQPQPKTTTCADAPYLCHKNVNKPPHNCALIKSAAMEEELKYSFSSVNCNSLNISCPAKNIWKKKVFAIAQLKSDIILLSDVRLSSKNKGSGIRNLRNYFQTNPFKSYEFFYNSTSNKRGVGILISRSLALSETNRYTDQEENILGLQLQNSTGNFITVISIYGPNRTDEQFFNNLSSAITRLGNNNLIVGGDWNCTFSTENIQYNIDCANMVESPNFRHSQLLNELCNRHELSDPFRYLWPNRKDFSYVPRNKNQLNRSR